MKVHQYLTMWNIFKRKIHEPLAGQLADLDHYPQEFAKLITNGLDCDVLPGSSGPFGGPSKPMPVNPFDRRLKIDLPYAYGVTQFVKDFPYGLPDALINFYGMHLGETFARHARKKPEIHSFTRKKGH